ncbi:MAG: type II toxin-antitoxin system RelE/ParE family toxin [Acidobacteriota bacterium]|nr:type II toxin-antitoxin system RelE/ParE family toxin [Acidobacteriota bacterium]
MEYLIEFADRAARDLNALYERIHASESTAAARWYNGLEKAVYTLKGMPRRCPEAPESKKAKRPLRHLLYGKKPHIYRVIFEIDEARKMVRLLTIRHGAMEEAKPGELR